MYPLGLVFQYQLNQKQLNRLKSHCGPIGEHLHIYSNGYHMYYTMRGILDILPMDIYVNDNSMSNIFSLKEVAYSFCVTMDTKEDHAMLVNYIKY